MDRRKILFVRGLIVVMALLLPGALLQAQYTPAAPMPGMFSSLSQATLLKEKQDEFEGFLIHANNDTTTASLRVPVRYLTDGSRALNWKKLQTGLEARTADSAYTLRQPSSGEGFGLRLKGAPAIFMARLSEDSVLRFQELETNGPALRVYRYVYEPRGMALPGVRYTLERADGQLFFMHDDTHGKAFKKKLAAFLSGTPRLDDLLWGRFLAWGDTERDMHYIVSRINDPSLGITIKK